eukprot:scaffold228702_cov27-Tisochrysis_lutea.AAC.1
MYQRSRVQWADGRVRRGSSAAWACQRRHQARRRRRPLMSRPPRCGSRGRPRVGGLRRWWAAGAGLVAPGLR